MEIKALIFDVQNGQIAEPDEKSYNNWNWFSDRSIQFFRMMGSMQRAPITIWHTGEIREHLAAKQLDPSTAIYISDNPEKITEVKKLDLLTIAVPPAKDADYVCMIFPDIDLLIGAVNFLIHRKAT